MKTKREKIEFLLCHYCDFYETLEQSQTMRDSAGESLKLMPPMSRHPSVVELDKAIRKVRTVMPTRTAHMMAFYCAEWRTINRKVKTRNPRGKVQLVDTRVRERVVPAWVRRKKVEDALSVVTHTFQGEVFIPTELQETIAA